MTKIYYHEDKEIQDELKAYVVVMAKYQKKWIMVRNKKRTTWELPGGRREDKEDIMDAAARELFEESGARKFRLYSICPYSVKEEGRESFGHIYFAEVEELEFRPEFEIGEIALVDFLPEALTYPYLQSSIYKMVETFVLEDEGKEYTFFGLIWIRRLKHNYSLNFSEQVKLINNSISFLGKRLASKVKQLFKVNTSINFYKHDLDWKMLIGRNDLHEKDYLGLFWDKVKPSDFVMEFQVIISDRSVILTNLQFPRKANYQQKKEFIEFWVGLLSELELDVIRTWENRYFTDCWNFLEEFEFDKNIRKTLPLNPKPEDFRSEVGKFGVPIIYFKEEPLFIVQYVALKEFQQKQQILDHVGMMLANFMEDTNEHELADKLRKVIENRDKPSNLVSLENKLIGNNLSINLIDKRMILLEANWRYLYYYSDLEEYEHLAKASVINYLISMDTGVNLKTKKSRKKDRMRPNK